MILYSIQGFFLLLLATIIPRCASTEVADEQQVPNFVFSWLNDNSTFQAGDVATIKIKVLGYFNNKGNASLHQSSFSPTFSVNGKVGNSSLVSGVIIDTPDDTENWKVMFTPIRVGLFNILITEDPFKVFDSSLHFDVVPGKIYQSVCLASWMNMVDEFDAGAVAAVLIQPKDAFGNSISNNGEDLSPYNFTLFARYWNGSFSSAPNITRVSWNEIGSITIEYIATQAGDFLLEVLGGNETLNGCPLPFKVNPGPLDVSTSLARLKFDIQVWQFFSVMEILIYEQDLYGNPVSGSYDFDVNVVESETNLSLPISDLHFDELEPGIKMLSFALLEPGNFLLSISNAVHNKTVSNTPIPYSVFIGYCDDTTSIVNGSGLNDSIAGETSTFSLYLNDVFQYPSFVEIQSIQVRILGGNSSDDVQPFIYPIVNDSTTFDASAAPAPSMSKPVGQSKDLASTFSVIYTLKKSGMYEIYVFCGNVLLNKGRPFQKEVRSGEVNVALSRVISYSEKISKHHESEIVIELLDSFSNPVPSQKSRLKLEVASGNISAISGGTFMDYNNGTYTGYYVINEVGTYEICVSFDAKHLSPCPLVLGVYSEEYFPRAIEDKITVWEDESVAFDVLANDYFAGSNASLLHVTKPSHGSLLQYGFVFRYTPHQDYHGNDLFLYTISDANANLASAVVNVTILNSPPQFVSFPAVVQATEDVVSPRHGGFTGIQMRYSNPDENISVVLNADHGFVFLAPMLMHCSPAWEAFAVFYEHNETDLTLIGPLEVLNEALQSLKYLGHEHFYGEDTIRVSARNSNGQNDIEIGVSVDPINDPPYMHVPNFILLKQDEDGTLLFDKEVHRFEFSVGDPDLQNFPGLDSHFVVTFSVEVDYGSLTTILRSELIDSTELKLMKSNQWQPLEEYVTISKHFTVKANGVRFRGTLEDCNKVMQNLSYHGEKKDAVLTVKVNDMGHFGCLHPHCSERVSTSLCTEASLNLFYRKPMNPFATTALGAAIVIEFIAVVTLGAILLFFTCKCAVLLGSERWRRTTDTGDLVGAT